MLNASEAGADGGEAKVNESVSGQKSAGEKLPPLTYHRANERPYRINVLDLLKTFGKPAATSHIMCDIDMSNVEAARHKSSAEGHKVSITAYLLKAIALAQINYPESRTQALPWGRQVTFGDITAGFTVERLMPGGPTVFFGEIDRPHEKSVAALADELHDYAGADIMKLPKLKLQKLYAELPGVLRAATLTLAVMFPALRLKCMSATFGLSSLGALGIDVVFGPSVCTSVFGVGEVADQAVVRENQVVVRPMLTLMLSFDQRSMDAGVAARFLHEIKMMLERPTAELC